MQTQRPRTTPASSPTLHRHAYLIFLLRVALGWLMFYAGISKMLDPEWSAAGFLTHATTFPDFYAWFAQPGIISITNILNEWGLMLIGASLIVGAFVRLSSLFGIVLMLLYYFPSFDFPYAGAHGFLVDSHIIYALVFAVLAALNAGRYYGIDSYIRTTRLARTNPILRSLLK